MTDVRPFAATYITSSGTMGVAAGHGLIPAMPAGHAPDWADEPMVGTASTEEQITTLPGRWWKTDEDPERRTAVYVQER